VLERTSTSDLSLRFFVTAPLFLIVAGLLMARDGSLVVISRWMPGALTATHLIALGFLVQVLCGVALQGRAPGAGPFARHWRLLVNLAHGALVLGTIGVGWGLSGGPGLVLVLGAGLVALGLVTCMVALAISARSPSTAIVALALGVTVLLGLGLTVVLLDWVRVPGWVRWVEVHAAWGLLAWIGVLAIGVAADLPAPGLVHRGGARHGIQWLSVLLVFAVAVASLTWIMGLDPLGPLLFATVTAIIVGFALGRLVRLPWVRREALGPVLGHWGLSLLSLGVAGVAWILDGSGTLVGMLVVVVAGVGLGTGLLLRALPNLARPRVPEASEGPQSDPWIEAQGPPLGALVPMHLVRAQLVLQLLTLVLLSGALVASELVRLVGVCLSFSAFLLFLIVTRAARAAHSASGAIQLSDAPAVGHARRPADP
jgi:hypothetical protein